MHAKLYAMEAIAARSYAQMESDVEQGVPATPAASSRVRLGSAYICKLSSEIANLALRASGASAISSDNPAQRIARDAMTLSMHGQMNIETAYEDYGRLALGMPGFGGPPGAKKH